jgi:hypothetical protein
MADSHLLAEEDLDYDGVHGDDPEFKNSSSWLPWQAGQASFLRWLPWIIHLLLFSINGSLLLTLAWRGNNSAASSSSQTRPFFLSMTNLEACSNELEISQTSKVDPQV